MRVLDRYRENVLLKCKSCWSASDYMVVIAYIFIFFHMHGGLAALGHMCCRCSGRLAALGHLLICFLLKNLTIIK
jgi:hypothetical protein